MVWSNFVILRRWRPVCMCRPPEETKHRRKKNLHENKLIRIWRTSPRGRKKSVETCFRQYTRCCRSRRTYQPIRCQFARLSQSRKPTVRTDVFRIMVVQVNFRSDLSFIVIISSQLLKRKQTWSMHSKAIGSHNQYSEHNCNFWKLRSRPKSEKALKHLFGIVSFRCDFLIFFIWIVLS